MKLVRYKSITTTTTSCSLPVRTWQADPSSGLPYLSSISTAHRDFPQEGVRTHVHCCLYLLEPSGGGRTRLTHVCRTDTRYEPEGTDQKTGNSISSLGHAMMPPPPSPLGVALRSGTADRGDISSPPVCWRSGTPSERAVSERLQLSTDHQKLITGEEGSGDSIGTPILQFSDASVRPLSSGQKQMA